MSNGPAIGAVGVAYQSREGRAVTGIDHPQLSVLGVHR
ncbi:hypothetical protein FHS42_000030 [Streptomyces zagrosensis]|uniref:Uncharacterized protein n=1 Tax=Streptomyces zagrosensis TaxID=1042984 RepID=A0A7W9Q571_9ACTN|nr:hypothetical protein [Streptomyces zagrosensis]